MRALRISCTQTRLQLLPKPWTIILVGSELLKPRASAASSRPAASRLLAFSEIDSSDVDIEDAVVVEVVELVLLVLLLGSSALNP
jgi:hypothetical protein